jgi:hypothetical protein
MDKLSNILSVRGTFGYYLPSILVKKTNAIFICKKKYYNRWVEYFKSGYFPLYKNIICQNYTIIIPISKLLVLNTITRDNKILKFMNDIVAIEVSRFNYYLISGSVTPYCLRSQA